MYCVGFLLHSTWCLLLIYLFLTHDSDAQAVFFRVLAATMIFFLCWACFIYLSHAKPLHVPPSPISLLQPFNGTSSQLLAGFNTSTPPQCTSKNEWFSPPFEQEDCKGALDWLFIEELATGRTKKEEFLTHEARAISKNKRNRTPRSYVYRMSRVQIS